MIRMITRTMHSVLYTMGVASAKSPKQKIGDPYTIPPPEVRKLGAELILEEALETVHALGFQVSTNLFGSLTPISGISDLHLQDVFPPDLEKIIDGACDTIYVSTWVMATCGVPDQAHLDEVCLRNNQKFPGGVAIISPTGKYLKPEGWIPPNHKQVQEDVLDGAIETLKDLSLDFVNAEAAEANAQEDEPCI